MITFTYKDIAAMQEALMLGTLQRTILEYFQGVEDVYDISLEKMIINHDVNLYGQLIFNFDEFNLSEEVLENPLIIANTHMNTLNQSKRTAAIILHEYIEKLYMYFLTLSMTEKEKIRLTSLYTFYERNWALIENIDYCTKKLAILEEN